MPTDPRESAPHLSVDDVDGANDRTEPNTGRPCTEYVAPATEPERGTAILTGTAARTLRAPVSEAVPSDTERNILITANGGGMGDLTSEFPAPATEPAHVEGSWQPFVSAPAKHGEIIIVYREDAGVFAAEYHDPDDDGGAWFTAGGVEDLTGDLPSHWHPLPPAPVSEAVPGDEEPEYEFDPPPVEWKTCRPANTGAPPKNEARTPEQYIEAIALAAKSLATNKNLTVTHRAECRAEAKAYRHILAELSRLRAENLSAGAANDELGDELKLAYGTIATLRAQVENLLTPEEATLIVEAAQVNVSREGAYPVWVSARAKLRRIAGGESK